MALTKEDILGLQDIQVKEIDVPEWDSTVFIRQLSRGQADGYFRRRFNKSELTQRGRDQQFESEVTLFGHDSWLVAQGVCDADGKRLFSDADVKKLEEKNADVIGFIAVEIVKFSGMSRDIEELDDLKN